MSVSKICAFATATQWVLAGLLAYPLVNDGVTPWLAVALIPLITLSVPAILLAIQFMTGACLDRRPEHRLELAAMLRLWCSETWMWWRMFSWHMPFRAQFPEPNIVHDALRPAVLLVHGYVNNRAVWKPLIHSPYFAHCNLATVNLEPAFASIDEYCPLIACAVRALAQKSGSKQITLVCHSMGGLVARAYLRYQAQHKEDAFITVNKIITINTPHEGTIFAHCSPALNAQQMRPESEYLKQLKIDTMPMVKKIVCIGSVDDNLIVPRSSQWLDGARPISVAGIGHLTTVAHHQVLRLIAHELASNQPPSPKDYDR